MTATIIFTLQIALKLVSAVAGVWLATAFFDRTTSERFALRGVIIWAGTILAYAIFAWHSVAGGAWVPLPSRVQANPFVVSFAFGLAVCVPLWLYAQARDLLGRGRRPVTD